MKLLLLAIGIIFVGFVFTSFKIFNILQPEQNYDGRNLTKDASITPQAFIASLFVDYGNGKTNNFDSIQTSSDESAFSILKKKMDETGVTVISKNYDFGMMVESIGGVAGSTTYFWAYSVNGQMGSVSADKYLLNSGDLVEWTYTKIQ